MNQILEASQAIKATFSIHLTRQPLMFTAPAYLH